MVGGEKQFVVDENGRKSAVLLPIGEYEALLEDLEDLATIADRRQEPMQPLSAVRQRLEAKWINTEST